jgi:hypothetical protein
MRDHGLNQKKPMGKIAMDRPITPHEAAIVRWMLENASVGDVVPYKTLPIEQLRVIGGCDCGCCSLDFVPNAWGGGTMIADATAVYANGQRAGLILFGRDGAIALLEVHDWDPGSSHRVPEIADLRA